jgi:type II secretory ATPase GspE/PulE/Tfp pilus assembly ATPase PilB-like protein
MPATKGHRIGEMLLDEEVITKEQLEECLQEQKVTGEKVGEVMIRKGYVSLEVLMAFLGTQMGIPYAPFKELKKVPKNIVQLLPEELMRTQYVIPMSKKGNTLIVATADPSNLFVTDDIKLATRMEVELRLSSEKEIKAALDQIFGFKEEDQGELVKASGSDDTFGAAPVEAPKPQRTAPTAARAAQTESFSKHAPEEDETPFPTPQKTKPAATTGAKNLENLAQAAAANLNDEPAQAAGIPIANLGGADTPVISFLSNVLVEATKNSATEIHFEPYEKRFRIRWRIDGILQEVQSPPRSLASALAQKLKTMAEMDGKEAGVSQSGRMRIKIPGRDVAMTLLITPTKWGEKIVMHLLNVEESILDLDKLGMESMQIELYKRILQQPYGMILVIAPKSSGKTTTCYATLNALNQSTKNISAVDEPVDYSLDGVNQIVVNEKRGLTFAKGVRAMLDQDTDVLLVGQLPDQETAKMVLDAVPNGHLVLSAMAANEPSTAINHLANFGIEPYLIGSALTAIVNQRLLRIICPKCKDTYEAPPAVAKFLGAPQGRKVMLFRGKGCDQCSHTGYKGRQAVFEVLAVTEVFRELVAAKAGAQALRKAMLETPGFISLRMQVAKKVLSGATSYEEFLRVAV